MSTRHTSGSAPQHSHPHNNTVSRNEKFWVDQVTLPPPPQGNDKGWGTTRGGEGTQLKRRQKKMWIDESISPTQRATQICELFGEKGGGRMVTGGEWSKKFSGVPSAQHAEKITKKWPTCGQDGYIAPAFLGIPGAQQMEKIINIFEDFYFCCLVVFLLSV